MKHILPMTLMVLFLSSLPAQGAEQRRVHRVGVVYLGSPEQTLLTGLRDGLLEIGLIEGDNLLLDMPFNETLDGLRETAARLAADGVDLIVSLGGVETATVKEMVQDIPILFLAAEHTLVAGLIESLARPNTNLSGLTLSAGGAIEGKRLEVFSEVTPALKRLALLYDARGHYVDLSTVKDVARELGITLYPCPIRSLLAEEQVIHGCLEPKEVDGIFVICSSLFSNLEPISRYAEEKKLPLYSCSAMQVADGRGLVTYSPDFYYLGYRGARYVDRILKGADIRKLPVETPNRYELVINLTVAKAMGFDVPPEVLIRSDKVFN